MAFGTPSAIGTATHTTGATATPGLPTHSSGDGLYYAAISRLGTTGITTPPSGYTLLASSNGMFLYAKKAGGSESAQQITFDEATNVKSVFMWACSGGDLDNLGSIVHAAVGTSDATADAAIETSALTISQDNCQILWLGIWVNDLAIGAVTVTDPTQADDRIVVVDTTTGADHTVCVAYKNQTTATNITVDSFAFSAGSEQSRELTLALKDVASSIVTRRESMSRGMNRGMI